MSTNSREAQILPLRCTGFTGLTAFAGLFALVWVIIQECDSLGFTYEGIQLVGYTLGLGIVGIALEAVWRKPIPLREADDAASVEAHRFGRGSANIAVSIGIVLLWVFWVAEPGIMSVMPAFWLVLVLLIPACHLREPARC